MTRHKCHTVIGAIMARRDYAIICVVTRMKFHVVIRTITTRQNLVTKDIMRKMREIVHILGENEPCVYNRNSFTFAYVRFRSIVGATYPGNRRKKSNIHFVPFIQAANLRISLVKSNSEISVY